MVRDDGPAIDNFVRLAGAGPMARPERDAGALAFVARSLRWLSWLHPSQLTQCPHVTELRLFLREVSVLVRQRPPHRRFQCIPLASDLFSQDSFSFNPLHASHRHRSTARSRPHAAVVDDGTAFRVKGRFNRTARRLLTSTLLQPFGTQCIAVLLPT